MIDVSESLILISWQIRDSYDLIIIVPYLIFGVVLEIIGRKEEQSFLLKKLKSNESELIAVYGRRRVGKTYLIRNFFEQQK